MSRPLSPVRARLQEAALRLYADKGSAELSVSELADAAGVARGTIYNNLTDVNSLFEEVAGRLASELNASIVATLVDTDDPAQRLATGIRLTVQRASDEPHWGRFLVRFWSNSRALTDFWAGEAASDLRRGIAAGRYDLRRSKVKSALALVSGAALSSMRMVLEGHQTWRQAGSDAAEFVLRSLGVSPAEAHQLATSKLPRLARGP